MLTTLTNKFEMSMVNYGATTNLLLQDIGTGGSRKESEGMGVEVER
jgi:hypothetical protein